MNSLDGDSQKENANGDLAENGGEAVGNFTKPPILWRKMSDLGSGGSSRMEMRTSMAVTRLFAVRFAKW
jgi:hypothetical protein